ncbi:MAG: hypothetical protein HUJ26_05585 [Planctomycetaceae bacterium]|nr:hypothetical protein [Planctomycetaceae bacterium]
MDKLDRSIAEIEKDKPGWRWPLKTIIRFATSYMRIQKGINWEGNFSVVLYGWNKPDLNDEAFKHLVFRIPFDDPGMMAGNFKLTDEDFVEGKIHRIEDQVNTWGNHEKTIYACRHGRNAVLCQTKEVLEQYLQAKPLSSRVASDPGGRLTDSDILFQVDTQHFRPEKYDDQKAKILREIFVGQPDEVIERASQIIDAVEHGFLSLKVDRGAHFRMQFSLDDELDDSSKQLLKRWSSPTGEPSLTGFPDGDVILALSKTAGELGNPKIVQQITAWVMKELIRNRDLANIIVPYLQPKDETFHGVIDELWNSILEARSGVYKNEKPTVDGLANLLLIFKPKNADQFRTQLASLVKFSRGTVYKPNNQTPEPITEAEIEALIVQLNADSFQERSAATLRLKLLGEPALPLLEQSAQGQNTEVALRSRRLVKTIRKNVEESTENLLKEGLATLPVPEFVFYENHRQILGCQVDLLEAVWKGKHKINEDQLKELVGPQGHEILLVHVNEEIILFWGSDRALLEKSVELLKAGKSGVDSRRELFTQHASKNRLMETHASLQKLYLMAGDSVPNRGPLKEVTEDVSSFSLELTPTHLLGDATFPKAEFRLLSRGILY